MGQFLSKVKSSKAQRPFRVLLYGKGGIGKSTWASGAPRPVFIGEHGGTDEIDVPQFPKPEAGWTLEDVFACIDELRTDAHDRETLVLDTLDWLEPILWRSTCRRGFAGRSYSNLEEFGYGKGASLALDDWRMLLSRLEDLEDKRGMNIVLLAHSHIKTFQNPEGDSYDRFEMKLDKKASSMFIEWPKAVLFATFETYTKKENKSDRKAKAYGEGARIVHTQPRPAWDAKSRYPLPATLPLSWDEFAAAARRAPLALPEDAVAAIKKLLGEVDDVTRKQGEAALVRCGENQEKLGKLLEWIRGRVVAAAE